MELRILRLDDVEAEDAEAFGGKGSGLARLRRLGAAVPEAFVVAATTRPPREWTDGERTRLRAAGAALLRDGPLVVRSSAIDEDSARRSFAGLFEWVLDVRDLPGMEEAAARCIGSGSAERVRACSGTQSVLPVGLVVQRQVDARVAGVCFTRDPSGRDRAIVIEAVAGLGLRLVSGHARPERWRVYRNGLPRPERTGEGDAWWGELLAFLDENGQRCPREFAPSASSCPCARRPSTTSCTCSSACARPSWSWAGAWRREPDPSRLQEGEVLVVEFADPGWTPLFPRAAAVVMEVGGMMCHAAVVARELGVPAVFGVADATTLLREGTRVTVDGDKGTVTPA
jgi:pyruvate,water dikinase